MTHFTPIVPKKRSINNSEQNSNIKDNTFNSVKIGGNNYFENIKNKNRSNSISIKWNNNEKSNPNSILKVSRNWILPPRPRPGRKSVEHIDTSIFQNSHNDNDDNDIEAINDNNNTTKNDTAVLAFLNLDDSLSQTSTLSNNSKRNFDKTMRNNGTIQNNNNGDLNNDDDSISDIKLEPNFLNKKIKPLKSNKTNKNAKSNKSNKGENKERKPRTINTNKSKKNKNIKDTENENKDKNNKKANEKAPNNENLQHRDVDIDLFNFKLKIKKELLENQDEFILDNLNKKYDESLLVKNNNSISNIITENISNQSSERSILKTKDIKKLRNKYCDGIKKNDSFILSSLSPSTTLVSTPINNGYDIESIIIPNIHSNYNSTKNFNSINDDKIKQIGTNSVRKENIHKFNINYNYDISNNNEFIEPATNEALENNRYDNIWTFIPRYSNDNYTNVNNDNSITNSNTGTINDNYVYIAPSLEELIDEQDCML